MEDNAEMNEIDQELKNHTKSNLHFTFTPHLTPMFRGILSTIYIDLKPGFSIKKIEKISLMCSSKTNE